MQTVLTVGKLSGFLAEIAIKVGQDVAGISIEDNRVHRQSIVEFSLHPRRFQLYRDAFLFRMGLDQNVLF